MTTHRQWVTKTRYNSSYEHVLRWIELISKSWCKLKWQVQNLCLYLTADILYIVFEWWIYCIWMVDMERISTHEPLNEFWPRFYFWFLTKLSNWGLYVCFTLSRGQTFVLCFEDVSGHFPYHQFRAWHTRNHDNRNFSKETASNEKTWVSNYRVNKEGSNSISRFVTKLFYI